MHVPPCFCFFKSDFSPFYTSKMYSIYRKMDQNVDNLSSKTRSKNGFFFFYMKVPSLNIAFALLQLNSK